MLFDEMVLDSVLVKRKPHEAGMVRATFVTEQWQDAPLNGLFCLDGTTKMIKRAPLYEFWIDEIQFGDLATLTRPGEVELSLEPGERITARVTWQIKPEKNSYHSMLIRDPAADGKNPGITPEELVALGQAVGHCEILRLTRPAVAPEVTLFPETSVSEDGDENETGEES